MGVLNRSAFLATLLKEKAVRGRIPLTVVINITSKCNLQCGYCYGEYFKQKNKNFTTDELLNLIDDLAKMGTRSITLGGGEPLIRDDIGQIINRIKQNGIECGMNTNGLLIPKRIKELKKIDMVTVSLDGPKELNDKTRGIGSFEKITAGIDCALKNEIKVHTTTVISNKNLQAVDWIISFAKEKNIQAEFNFLFESMTKERSKLFMAENSKLRNAAKKILEYKKKGAPILFSKQVYEQAYLWPDYQKRLFYSQKPDFKFIKCYAGRFMMFIDSNGKVYPCAQLIGIFNALDFKKTGIKKAWENLETNPCKACYFPCFNEFNLIADLNPNVIFGQVLSSVKRQ